MSAVKLIVHKDIESDIANTTWAVTMRVVEAQDIPSRIFVLKYTPYSKYTGPATHMFYNVAYLDELASVPDKIPNSKKACMYRSDVFTHRFNTYQACVEFMSEVEGYIRRLVDQVTNGLNTQSAFDVLFTGSSSLEYECTEHISADSGTSDEFIETISNSDVTEPQESEVEVLSLNANGD